jgi:hypothetical protein
MTPLHAFVAQFPATSQHLVRAWFAAAAAQHPASPEALLSTVERVIGHKFDWATGWGSRQACSVCLLALRHQREAALAYAQTLLQVGQTSLNSGARQP